MLRHLYANRTERWQNLFQEIGDPDCALTRHGVGFRGRQQLRRRRHVGHQAAAARLQDPAQRSWVWIAPAARIRRPLQPAPFALRVRVGEEGERTALAAEDEIERAAVVAILRGATAHAVQVLALEVHRQQPLPADILLKGDIELRFYHAKFSIGILDIFLLTT